MIRRRGILKIKRLLTINGFVERTMKKGVFHVKLMYRPVEKRSPIMRTVRIVLGLTMEEKVSS
jgi:hypothetical protein